MGKHEEVSLRNFANASKLRSRSLLAYPAIVLPTDPPTKLSIYPPKESLSNLCSDQKEIRARSPKAIVKASSLCCCSIRSPSLRYFLSAGIHRTFHRATEMYFVEQTLLIFNNFKAHICTTKAIGDKVL